MSDYHPQEELLVRFADDQISPAEREQVSKLIESDPEAAGLLQALEATRLPLQQIRDSELPPARQTTVDMVNEWTPAEKTATGRRFGIGAIAATLALGMFAGHVISNAIQHSGSTTEESTMVSAETTPKWIRLVADYHRLYDRQTLEHSPSVQIDTVSASVSDWLARPVNIPDLTDAGIDFKRAQQLTVEDDTLVQLAYLPELDKPVAVCIRLINSSQVTAINYNSFEGMQYAEWQDGNHAVVIVGDLTDEKLQQIADTVKRTLFVS